MSNRITPFKKRSQSCYQKKINKLTKLYNNCPKIQAKHSLEEWLKKIKLPQGESR